MYSNTDVDFVSYVKLAFEAERERSDKFLTNEDLNELLNEEQNDDVCRDCIVGYPSRPLYREIGRQLNAWQQTKECPILKLPSYDLLDEQLYKESRADMIDTVNSSFLQSLSLWDMWSDDEKCAFVREILFTFHKRGLLDLLGMRKTVGTADYWPPPRKLIEATFEKPHTPDSASILTVGARALAKHCHRDSTDVWWGTATGKEADKNAHAWKVLVKILDHATWINIHQLPHDVHIVEARQENGYGVRWTSDGMQFRGFLEPQMVDGHEVGWKH